MAINSGFVDLGAILRFIDYLRAPKQSDVLAQVLAGGGGGNPFVNALPTVGEIAAGAQAGPTLAAAQRGATGATGATAPTPRDLLQRLVSNPRLLSDLSTDNFNKVISVAGGLEKLEPKPVPPTSQMQNLAEFERRGGQVTPETLGTALGVTNEPPSDLQLLEAINADRKAKGEAPYGVEAGLRAIANFRQTAGTNVTVNSPVDLSALGELISPFLEKSQVSDRQDAVSRLRFTMPQLDRARKVLETPGFMRWIANPIGQHALNALALGQDISGFTLIPGLNSEDLGEAQAALQTGISSAASAIAKIYENDISEPTLRRLQAVGQMGSLLATPDRALGALKAIDDALSELSDQQVKELENGGVTLSPAPTATTLPKVSQDFKARVEAKAGELLRNNPTRYPQGAKDPQLIRDTISAVRKEIDAEEKSTIPVETP